MKTEDVALAQVMVREASRDDCAAIAELYNHYIRTSRASFEEQPLPDESMGERIAAVQRAGLPWLVAEVEGGLAGYAYATAWNNRHAYRHTAEVTVYTAPGSEGSGVGTSLYAALFQRLKELGKHRLIAVITLPNDASVALHEKFGMVKCGHFDEVGYKFGEWIDVGYWLKRLDD